METAEIAKVAVSAAPYSIDKPYDYLVPAGAAGNGGARRPGHRALRPGQPHQRGHCSRPGRQVKSMPGLKPLLSVLDRGAGTGRRWHLALALVAAAAVLLHACSTRSRPSCRPGSGTASRRSTARGRGHGPLRGRRRGHRHSDGPRRCWRPCWPTGAPRRLDTILARTACGSGGWHWCCGLCRRPGRHGLRDRGPAQDRGRSAVGWWSWPSAAEEALHSLPGQRAILPAAAGGGASAGGRGADVLRRRYATSPASPWPTLRGMEKAGLVAFSEEEELRVPDLTPVRRPSRPSSSTQEQEAAFQPDPGP